jgi:hypothetical protein
MSKSTEAVRFDAEFANARDQANDSDSQGQLLGVHRPGPGDAR